MGRLEGMAAEYSRRARAARVTQGLPAVIEGVAVLNQIAGWMAEDEAERSVDAPSGLVDTDPDSEHPC